MISFNLYVLRFILFFNTQVSFVCTIPIEISLYIFFHFHQYRYLKKLKYLRFYFSTYRVLFSLYDKQITWLTFSSSRMREDFITCDHNITKCSSNVYNKLSLAKVPLIPLTCSKHQVIIRLSSP